jgi:hypothetical protein
MTELQDINEQCQVHIGVRTSNVKVGQLADIIQCWNSLIYPYFEHDDVTSIETNPTSVFVSCQICHGIRL